MTDLGAASERPPRERNRATPPSLLRDPIDDYVAPADGPGVVRYACTACGCRSPTPTHASCDGVGGNRGGATNG